jgi:hypothetical protein
MNTDGHGYGTKTGIGSAQWNVGTEPNVGMVRRMGNRILPVGLGGSFAPCGAWMALFDAIPATRLRFASAVVPLWRDRTARQVRRAIIGRPGGGTLRTRLNSNEPGPNVGLARCPALQEKVIHMDSQCPTLPIKIEEKYEKFQDSSWKWRQVQHSSRRNVRIACLTTQKRETGAGLGNPAYTRLRCTSAVVPLWRDKPARQPGRKTHGQSSLWCFLRKSLILPIFANLCQLLPTKKRCYA